jgi:hypothetical protein
LEGLKTEAVGVLYGKFLFYGHLVNFADFIVLWYIYSNFGMLHQDESGNPVLNQLISGEAGSGRGRVPLGRGA